MREVLKEMGLMGMNGALERGGFKDGYGGYRERKVVTGTRLVGYEVGDE